MKVLLDTCVWGGAKRELAESGHDAIWSGESIKTKRAALNTKLADIGKPPMK